MSSRALFLIASLTIVVTPVALVAQEGPKILILVPDIVSADRDARREALLRSQEGRWRAYEWTRLPGTRVSGFAGPDLVEAISTLTPWNFRHPWLGDERFWRDQVMEGGEGGFRYLRSIP